MASFLVVLEVEPMVVGQEYEHLNLHCTIMHWFQTNQPATAIQTAIEPIFAATAPVELTSGEPVLLEPSTGPKTIAANLVHKTESISVLHQRLFEALASLPARHAEPIYTQAGFTPHVSKQGQVRFETGRRHLVTAAYLVAAVKPANPITQAQKYRVVAKINLGSQAPTSRS